MPQTLVHLVGAARPNFMKVAPLYHALAASNDFEPRIVHTGQHYDRNMSEAFFTDLRLPKPDFHLEVGSGTHAAQTGGVMIGYERVCLENERPDWTVVVGDVNSTVAVALVCAKLHLPVAHLEAGLRSGDRSMPEEINRILTDAVADLLWTPTPDGDENLLREGVPAERIDRVGNIMIDSYELLRPTIESDPTPGAMGLDDATFGIVTLHRPANVDEPENLARLVAQLGRTAELLELVFPIHPRTRSRLERTGLYRKLSSAPGIRLVEPLGYIQFMSLVRKAAVAITDSGGIQEETTYLGIPCVTVRPNTERPITVEQGTNRLVEVPRIHDAVEAALRPASVAPTVPDLWDGRTAGRCVESLRRRVAREA